jgi:hypothetical protein
MPDRSKGSGQKKCSPWSSRLGVGRGAIDPTSGKVTVTKPPDYHGGRQDAYTVVAPVKKNKKIYVYICVCVCECECECVCVCV